MTCWNFFFFLFKALWTKNGSCIVYPCHAIIVVIDVSSGQQQFFMGHTDKVTVTMNKCIKLVNIFFENTKFEKCRRAGKKKKKKGILQQNLIKSGFKIKGLKKYIKWFGHLGRNT